MALKAYLKIKQPLFEIYDLLPETVSFLKRLLARDPLYRPSAS
jgi:hypothetical protein